MIPSLLDGKRAVVTGAGAGIGRATAQAFIAAGARVAVVDVDAAAARETVALLGARAGAFVADVADPGPLEAAFEAATTWLGGLDIVVNNAGVGAVRALHEYSDEEWQRLVGVNLTGVFHGIRAAVPRLLTSGGGSIVNVSSLSGIRPTRGEGPYSAAKAGVIALSAEAALEYGPDIRVNCVSPGVIDTPLTRPLLGEASMRDRVERRIPLKRAGTAEEVAAVVTFFASDMASYVTGANLVVDGGSVLPSHQTDDLLARFIGN